MANPGRYDLCPCGSGKKFARCCYDSSDAPTRANPDGLTRQGLFAGGGGSDIAQAKQLVTMGRLEEARQACLHVLQTQPDHIDALRLLALVSQKTGQSDATVEILERLSALQPTAEVHYNLGLAYARRGKVDLAITHFERALLLTPEHAQARNNLLLALNYSSDTDPSAVYNAHVDYAKRQEAPSAALIHAHSNDRSTGRRLKIGYVSPDFRRHPVACLIEPVLKNHHRDRFEVFCYSNSPQEDEVTTRLKSLADHWCGISRLSDDMATEQIRRDQIDILVDLAGHTALNRLSVFARKPAPIQITWLGYPNTTGLSTMDYYLTDAVCDPPDEPAYYTEKLLRLDGAFFCYAPPVAPVVAPSPACTRGFVTFGSLNTLVKLNDQVIDLWCEVLRANPTSRLLVYRDRLKGAVREHFAAQFAERGIGGERLQLRGELPSGRGHLDVYGEIDIALDTFPWSGHITSCEALWMGVPVITLYGRSHVGRMVASVLAGVGLPHLTAHSPQEYVETATDLCADPGQLERVRAGLRERLAASPLCDGAAFARKVEAAYREMWREWCKA